jgi:hypothetical protein
MSSRCSSTASFAPGAGAFPVYRHELFSPRDQSVPAPELMGWATILIELVGGFAYHTRVPRGHVRHFVPLIRSDKTKSPNSKLGIRTLVSCWWVQDGCRMNAILAAPWFP